MNEKKKKGEQEKAFFIILSISLSLSEETAWRMLILCFKDFLKKNPTKSFPSSQSVINGTQKIEGDLKRKVTGTGTG